jgi:hypothetical protein
MATREAWHQLDPVKMRRGDFEKLPFREDIGSEGYKGKPQFYRSRTYPNDVFVWTAFDKGAPVKGEWQMGAVDLGS